MRTVRRRTRANGEISTLRNNLRLATDRLFDAKRLLAHFLDESGYLPGLHGRSAADIRRQQKPLIDALNGATQSIAAVAKTGGAEMRGAKRLMPVPPPLGSNDFNAMAGVRNSMASLLSHVRWISDLAAADDLEVEGISAVRKTFSTYIRRSVLMNRQWASAALAKDAPEQTSECPSTASNPLTGIDQPLHQALTSALGSVKALLDIALEEVKISLNTPPPEIPEPIYENVNVNVGNESSLQGVRLSEILA